MIRVEIAYAQLQRSIIKSVALAQGSTIEQALAAVASDPDFLGVDLADSTVGIFGKVARRDLALKDGDRVEIYRLLLEEPKLARRRRASRKASKPVRS